jgi:hypothetical protein
MKINILSYEVHPILYIIEKTRNLRFQKVYGSSEIIITFEVVVYY